MTDKNPATIRYYDRDAYRTEFQAEVLSCEKQGEGFWVILDGTCFFPEEGGQTCDRGSLTLLAADRTELSVLDVQMDKDKVIRHLVATGLAVGSQVQGHIDWEHRFSNMQQHSGEHIFSGLVHRRYGYDNVGFHLSDSIVTMDFNGTLSEAQVEELERLVNRAIAENVEIKAYYPLPEELEKLDYRSKLDLKEDVRIVEVTGYDLCACCAPHVSHTGEIGGFRIQSLASYKGGVRISMLCGQRALAADRERRRRMEDLVKLLTTGEENLTEAVARLQKQVMEDKAELGRLRGQQLQSQIETLLAERAGAINGESSGETALILFTEGCDRKTMQNGVNRMMERADGLCCIFSKEEEDAGGYAFVIGSRTQDCRQVAANLRETLGAKGGGQAQMIQGSVMAQEENIRAALSEKA